MTLLLVHIKKKKERKKMKIKVYADWKHEEILGEKDYKEFKERKVNEMADNYFEDDYEFGEFLGEKYTCADIFKMTDEEREKVKKEWKAKCKADAKDNFADEWEYEEIVLEV